MSDDLVKRLRAIDKDIVVRRFDPEMSFDGMTAHKAADRIEKLTAALNCNLPDYDPKIGIVERLRQLGNWRVDGTKSSPIYNKSADHIEKLEAALREIAAASKVIVKAENMAQALVVVLTSHRKIALAALEKNNDHA